MTAWQIAMPAGQPGTAVWHVDLAAIRLTPARARWLSTDEQARAARFLRPQDRDRFVHSHLALRRILSGYLGRDPGDLCFDPAENGKPELGGPDRDRLRFNLSHSGSHALVAIADGTAIGVDVEVARPLGDVMAIARAHFHSGEITTLAGRSAAERPMAFLACWTRKEAVVKALGTGLSLPLDSFEVTLPPGPATIRSWARGASPCHDWSLHHLDLGAEAVGAVAIARGGESCALYRLPSDGETL
ncbi:4'-phosphopantetheinyl transferase family protein [Methylobacterium goesingense]|uniref:4'-phosphopantetheinyl transferase n=1 Tax=Methylobacterium goesingense TaxID=243690 RepID=A0ABV2LA32_9HYPH|nr:4'-phosphopantetheinyl transferase superfamily protein [Methylobacterium goesingense]GJD73525.1 hypothetical protein CFIICLFH_1753 [Methylobacterium goesingense]